ncbi:MAG: L-threonylcarbamoyladenylate synthase [Myxococcota bacterium]|nr:L-threonylcarbamoyladenylate synthase [Myxococcota bacterium]
MQCATDPPPKRAILRAAEILRDGGIIAYPTDTAYGLGCDLLNHRAVDRLYSIKKRNRRKPFSFVCADLNDIARYAQVDSVAFRLLKRLLPGPYTFVLHATQVVPRHIMPQRRTVGLRIPDHPVPQLLVRELGNPIISTTACRDGEAPLNDPEEIELAFRGCVDAVLDGGILPPERISSVISLLDSQPEVLREGIGDCSFFRE